MTHQHHCLLLRSHQSRIQPLLSVDDGVSGNTAPAEEPAVDALARPLVRSLATILIDSALTPNASNHSVVLRAVDEAIGVAIRHPARAPLFPDVFATVLQGENTFVLYRVPIGLRS